MTTAPLQFGGTVSAGTVVGQYYHYLCTEWVDRHEVPTEPTALAGFDSAVVQLDYHKFLAGGGKVRVQVGVTAEQWWLAEQLITGEALVLMANSGQIAGEPLSRVTRKALLPPSMIATVVPKLFRIKLNRRDVEAQRRRWGPELAPTFGFGVHDGDSGHALRMIGLDRAATGVFYKDSWPAGSFLEHSAGATAVASDPGVWHVQLDKLMTVLSFVLLPIAAWAAATGDHQFGLAPPPRKRVRSRPPDAADRARRFLDHCRAHDLLTEQAISDLITLFDRNVLFDRDKNGHDVLHHLHEIATTERAPGFDPGSLLCGTLRLLADPGSR